MSETRFRLLLLALLVTAFGFLAARDATPAAFSADVLQDPTEEPREGPIPCDPSYTRTVVGPDGSRIVKEGDSVTVHSQYRFVCTGETRKVNFIFVIENSGALRQGQGGREALDNVTKGARNFINQVSFDNGSRGGIMLYAASRTWKVPLTGGGGDEGRRALLDALATISIEPIGNSAGAGAAIRDATAALPVGIVTEFSNVMIIVDAGAMEVPGADLVDRYTTCNAARQSGVTVAVVSFPLAQRRLRSCASSGWFFQVNSDEGRNVPELFNTIAEGMLRGQTMAKVTYSDWPEDGFDYTVGSGYPRDPDFVVMGEAFWEFVGKTAPPTGQDVDYLLEIEPGVFTGGTVKPVSIWSRLEFSYAEGTTIKVEMPNPPICVYRHSPSECAAFAATLTPDAPETPVTTPTTASPTSPPTTPATEEPTDTPTPTDEPPPTPDTPTATEPTGPEHPIYLPVTHRRA